MNHPLLQWLDNRQLRPEITVPPVGARVRVFYRIREGEKERVQPFEGVVIRQNGGEHDLSATFTVRRVSQGFGVERTFPLHSPRIEDLKVLRLGRVRRARLYYLRQLRGKKARIPEKRPHR